MDTTKQIRDLQARIRLISEHLCRNINDHRGKGSLTRLRGRQRKLLMYLHTQQRDTYDAIIAELGIIR